MKWKFSKKVILGLSLLISLFFLGHREVLAARPAVTDGHIYMYVDGVKKLIPNVWVVKSPRDKNNMIRVTTNSGGYYKFGDGTDVLSCKGTICHNYASNYCPDGAGTSPSKSVSYCGLGCGEAPNAWTPIFPFGFSFPAEWGVDFNNVTGHFRAVGESTSHQGRCVDKFRGKTKMDVTFTDSTSPNYTNYFCRDHHDNATYLGSYSFEFVWNYIVPPNDLPQVDDIRILSSCSRRIGGQDYWDENQEHKIQIKATDDDGVSEIEYLHAFIDDQLPSCNIADRRDAAMVSLRRNSGGVYHARYIYERSGCNDDSDCLCYKAKDIQLPSTETIYFYDDTINLASTTEKAGWFAKVNLNDFEYVTSGNQLTLYVPFLYAEGFGSKDLDVYAEVSDYKSTGGDTGGGWWSDGSVPLYTDMAAPLGNVSIDADNLLSWDFWDNESGMGFISGWWGQVPASDACPTACDEAGGASCEQKYPPGSTSGSESVTVDSGNKLCAVFEVGDACRESDYYAEGIPVGFPWFRTERGSIYSSGGVINELKDPPAFLSSYLCLSSTSDNLDYNELNGFHCSNFDWEGVGFRDGVGDKVKETVLGDIDKMFDSMSGYSDGEIIGAHDDITFHTSGDYSGEISGKHIYRFTGGLTINSNVQYTTETTEDQNAVIVFIDEGNLVIDSSVSLVEGMFIIRDGQLKVLPSDVQLSMKGPVVAAGCSPGPCINLQRDLVGQNYNTPAEIFKYDSRYIDIFRSIFGEVGKIQFVESGVY